MSKDLAKLFASRFIQRPDVKAIQLDRDTTKFPAGAWFPDTKVDADRRPNSPHLPHGFNMNHLLAHIAGERTYGHYLLDDESKCKLFAFDIDLKDTGDYVLVGDYTAVEPGEEIAYEVVEGVNPRELWQTRKKSAGPARSWYKYQMKMLASKLANKVMEIGLETAVAYSGSKGLHVYGFMPEATDAVHVREGAVLALDMLDEFEMVRGKNFWEHKNLDPFHGYKNFSIEVFPKQTNLDGKSLGNLLRLPLGKNHKNPSDPTFFVDMTAPMGTLKPHPDQLRVLKEGNPFV